MKSSNTNIHNSISHSIYCSSPRPATYDTFISSPYESKEHFQKVREIKGEGKYLWFNLYTDYNIIGMSGF